ncbi:C40 family peptidase [Streptomyces sp. ODS05-4]|uniref:C40 family peptidase n=1 Tax=Streptomyces sp. ODS05-4 TaxID=2944939 RepID=UPI002108F41F|nr:C40 family peptidase [Streptomyces sp. ODS05-4]
MASHRRSSATPGSSRSARVTVLSAAAATAAALAAAPAGADPVRPADAPQARVDALFAEAEQATEGFNAAAERTDKLRSRVGALQDNVARGQEDINRMRDVLGQVAGVQYRSGGMDPALRLLLTSDPDGYLDRAAALDRMGEQQAGVLTELGRAQRKLDQQRAEAARTLADLERSRAAVAAHKRTVERKLAEARALLAAAPKDDRAEVGRASRGDGREDLPPLAGGVSGRAAAAVAAARSAVGRPYVWGANGPDGFDCSGLMQWSYAQAGVGIPRTSQGQRGAGRHVSLSEARPGDLVTYRDDASHVAMYMGNGQVVHAPYPGAPVRYDPVGMMPVSAVTRV